MNMSRGPHFLVREGRAVLPVGTHVVPPAGPDWPWRVGAEAFDAAFARLAALGFNTARIDLLWAAIEPEPGRYDETHLAVLDEVLAAARRHGIWLHPALFIGNEVGDAVWDVPWRAGRNPHTDPDLLSLQADHAAMLAARWRSDPALLAWDLTDEPPWWLFPETPEADARAWTARLAGALRAADPEHLVTVGTAAQEVSAGPFRADVVADLLDFACVHPYPIYSPELYPDSLLAARMTHAAAFETALAAGAGRPVMVHEYGASSGQFDPDLIAAYDRLLMWSSFGRGAIGYLSWTWCDAEPAAHRRAPYVRQPHETQFGLVDETGAERPRARVNADFAAAVSHLDLDGYAAAGPAPRAALMVPYEYRHRADPAGFGLTAAGGPAGSAGLAGGAGPYTSAEHAIRPDPGPAPLVAAWLNAFVLAARAGSAVRFAREELAGEWPDTRLLLLPAPLASTTTSRWHVRTPFWAGAEKFWGRGGTLYLSLSADVAIPDLPALAGCRIADRAPAGDTVALRFTRAWGPLSTGDILELPAAPGDLTTRGVRLAVTDAEVVAVDAEDEPVLVLARRGAGHTVVCAHPVELLLAGIADACRRHPHWWRLYAGLADLADAREDAYADHPDVTSGVLTGPRGGLVTLTNHTGAPVRAPLRLPAGAARAWRVDPPGPVPLVDPDAVDLGPYSATMVVWDRPGPDGEPM
jgi:endo-1,4-beta-mannosidase